jgi:hypothetical protein
MSKIGSENDKAMTLQDQDQDYRNLGLLITSVLLFIQTKFELNNKRSSL